LSQNTTDKSIALNPHLSHYHFPDFQTFAKLSSNPTFSHGGKHPFTPASKKRDLSQKTTDKSIALNPHLSHNTFPDFQTLAKFSSNEEPIQEAPSTVSMRLRPPKSVT